MEFIIAHWMPILASAAAVWVASAIAWMAINHHADDMKSLTPDAESKLSNLVKAHNIAPGVYGYPDFKKCKGQSPEERKAAMKEPMGILRVWKPINMSRPMILSFLFYIFIGVLIAYLGTAAGIPAVGPFSHAFRVFGTAGVLAHACGGVVCNMWFQESRRAMILNFVDGVVYGLITGAVFAALWSK